MVLSRFWVFALSIVAAAAAAAALLAQGMVNRQTLSDLDDGLRRDRLEVEQTLKLDARARLDAIAPLAAHPDVRTALRTATNRRSDDELRPLNGTLKPRLQELNRQLLGMSADLLFAVDASGVVVAQLGPSEARFGAGLGTFPLVERALAGYVRDDVWAYDGAVYRMAARPVIDAGGYVGAIVHGKKLDEGLATLLSKRVGGATIGFFRRDAIVGCFTPLDVAGAPTQAELGTLLPSALTNGEFAVGNVTPPVDVAGRGRAVFSLVTGSAAEAQVGYVIARPLTHLASPMELFDKATTEDFAQLPQGPLGGAAAGLFVLGMLFFWLEKDRPFGRLRKRAKELADRKIERLPIAEFGGGYRRIASDLNAAMDKAVEHASEHAPRKKANLDELLGPVSGTQAPSFYGFAGGAPPSSPDVAAAPPAARPAPAPARPAAPAAPAVPPRAPAAAPPPAPATPPPAPGTAPRPPVAPPAPPAAARPAPPEPAPATQGVPYMTVAPPPASDDDGPEEGATMIARIPESLISASATGQISAVSQAAADDEVHFRQVFEEFVATKQQCGEPTAGFTYEKFVQTLRKNRDQIVARHGAKGVRFTVYVKDGKAALKAAPVKE
jgi:hypothetical protein